MGVRRHARIASSFTEARDPILTREVCVRGQNTRYCIQCSIVSLYSNQPSYFLHPSIGASLLPMIQVSTGYDLRQRKGITKRQHSTLRPLLQLPNYNISFTNVKILVIRFLVKSREYKYTIKMWWKSQQNIKQGVMEEIAHEI